MELNYCQICGTSLMERPVEGRIRAYCNNCERPIHRNPKPTAGVLVVNEDEGLLLIKRTNPPAIGAWSIPAGYLEADEKPEDAAVRELKEETDVSLSISDISLFDTAFVKHPAGHHVLVIMYRSEVSEYINPTPGTDAAAARFWSVEELIASEETIEPGYEDVFRRVSSK